MEKKALAQKIIHFLSKTFLSRKGLAFLSFLVWFNLYMVRVVFGVGTYELYTLLSLEIGIYICLGLISFEKIKTNINLGKD